MQRAHDVELGYFFGTTLGGMRAIISLPSIIGDKRGARRRSVSRQPLFLANPLEAGRAFQDRLTSCISNSRRWSFFAGLVVLGLIPTQMCAQTFTTTQALTSTVSAKVKLVTIPSNVTLVNTGTVFNPYSGSMTITYRARTTAGTGMGAITLKATSDFSPGTGPLIANGDLTYVCASAALGTPCTSQTVSVSSQTNVVTIGAGACTGGGTPCSSVNPDSVALNFTLANKPTFKTGSYSSAVLTFTISAL